MFGPPIGSPVEAGVPEPVPAAEPQPGRAARLGRRLRRAVPFVSGVGAALVAIALFTIAFPGPRPLGRQDVDRSIASALAQVTPPPAFSAQVYAAVQPSLVLIETRDAGPSASADTGLGSGVVVDAQGDILTSLHVVADATQVSLTFADGSRSAGQVVTREPQYDIAVVRPLSPPAQLVPAVLGNPGALHVGDEAYVIGNPFGLAGSISAGVVSGLGRSFDIPTTHTTLHGLIQVDAAVNPGNSGGPLVNRDGQVVGIVTGLVNPTSERVFIGIGRAGPIDVAGGAAGLPPD